LVVLERIPGTLAALQNQLRSGTYHMLYFIGHGDFDERRQSGLLLFEDQERLSDRVSGADLGLLLHDHRSLRLVVLHACEGARTSRTDPFSGTAQCLVRQGMPAVIAMQFPISGEAAAMLARAFFGAIADGYAVDAALAEARKALFTRGSRDEWGTPVLFMRTPNGKLFDLARAGRQNPIAAPQPASSKAGSAGPARIEEPASGLLQTQGWRSASRTRRSKAHACRQAA
jgi:CHAT domain-containing protein